ncbi:MAG: BrnT family toxin, partial [Desulfamplus sp.]|nr:BrnT family toxin [Desulfamplus sp.]
RWIGLGLLYSIVVVVVFTEPRNDTIRIISARKANRKEQKNILVSQFLIRATARDCPYSANLIICKTIVHNMFQENPYSLRIGVVYYQVFKTIGTIYDQFQHSTGLTLYKVEFCSRLTL